MRLRDYVLDGMRLCPECFRRCPDCSCDPCACPASQAAARRVLDTARAIVGGLTAEAAYGKGPQQGRLM